MLVRLVVSLVTHKGSCVFSHGMGKITLLLIKKAYLYKSISSSLKCKCLCQNGVLEVSYGLLDLIGFGKYHTKLVKDLRLLIEVW